MAMRMGFLVLLAPLLLLMLLTTPVPLNAAETTPSPTNSTTPSPTNSTTPSPTNSTVPPASPPPASNSTCSRSGTVAGNPYNHTFCVLLQDGITLAWSIANNSIVAVFSSQLEEAYGWVSFGWSPECKMVKSSVIVGWGNSEETSRTGVDAFYLESTSYQTVPSYSNNVFKPKLDGFILTADPTVEISDDGTRITTGFAVQVSGGGSSSIIAASGTQCVIFSDGPKLTNGDYDAQPNPGSKLKGHSRTGAGWARMDFSTGTLAATPTSDAGSPPSPPSPPKASAMFQPWTLGGLLLTLAVSFTFSRYPSGI